MRRRIAFALVVPALVVGLVAPGQAAEQGGPAREVRLTLTNLTPGQAFSAPLFAVGTKPHIFLLGRKASFEVALIAEEGDNSALAAKLEARGVREVIALTDPVMPGQSVSVDVMVKPGESLSVETMLVQTNDGFVGVSHLPLDAIHEGSLYLRTFDAGTERNNEMAAFIPGPPFDGHMRDPQGGVITYHPGIMGIADLDPNVYGWDEPSAMLTLEGL